MPNSGMVSLTAPKGVLLTCGHGPSLCAASMVVVESREEEAERGWNLCTLEWPPLRG